MLVLAVVPFATANADETDETAPGEEQSADFEKVESMVVYGRAEKQIGFATSGSEGRIGKADLELRPIGRVGELLETIPGMIATQHSGPGKANQLFLRGFNLDHGTDFSVHFDGVPINLRTHAHGQGYLDLNFVIPELVASIDYRKGPYRADVGDFSSAGSSFFRTYDQLPDSIASVTIGEDAYIRGLVAANVPVPVGEAILAVEGKSFDDPFKLDANLLHISAFAKWTRPLGPGTLRLSALGYHAEWHSTDQVPRRAIHSTNPAISIPRLGYEDPDAGGTTTRIGATVGWEEDDDNPLALSAYVYYYRFKLFSNFTYYLDDPVNGDEFSQREQRVVGGASGSKDWDLGLFGSSVVLRTGANTRLDVISGLGLTNTVDRQYLSTVRRDDVNEWSASGYLDATWTPLPWMTWIVGGRGDLFVFDVNPQSGVGADTNGGVETDGLVSPKISLILRPYETVALYLNGGGGFHSNDARGTTIRVAPDGQTVDSVDPIARQWGAEVGARWQPGPRLHLAAAFWFMTSQSELVYVGDAGATEPAGSSRRYGVELASFVRPVDWLAFDASYAVSDARFKNAPGGDDRIPGAIESVLSAGATLTAGPVSGGVRLRHFGSYPLLQDNSQRAGSTTLVNLEANYDWRSFRFGLTVINVFDSKDKDIEYYYESRLQPEPQPVEDVHLHPVEPRQIRASVTARF
jgi:hypothetical protein